MDFGLIFSFLFLFFFPCPLPWWQCPSLARRGQVYSLSVTLLWSHVHSPISIPKPQLWKLLAHKYLDFLVFNWNYIPHYLLGQTQKPKNLLFFFSLWFNPCCSFWQSRSDLKRINQTRPVLKYFYLLVDFLRRWKMWTQTFGEKGIWMVSCCWITEDPIPQQKHGSFPNSDLSYPLLLPQILSLKRSFKFGQTQMFVSSK